MHALGPVDLDLRSGEFFAVVGPSGCGKSTLLEILAGLQAPSGGTVTFEGRSVAGAVPDGVGVVCQEDASFPWLSVLDNAAFSIANADLAAGFATRIVRITIAVGAGAAPGFVRLRVRRTGAPGNGTSQVITVSPS